MESHVSKFVISAQRINISYLWNTGATKSNNGIYLFILYIVTVEGSNTYLLVVIYKNKSKQSLLFKIEPWTLNFAKQQMFSSMKRTQ